MTFSSGWWFGTFFIFPHIGLLIIPIDELIFFRGVAQPPTSKNPRVSGFLCSLNLRVSRVLRCAQVIMWGFLNEGASNELASRQAGLQM